MVYAASLLRRYRNQARPCVTVFCNAAVTKFCNINVPLFNQDRQLLVNEGLYFLMQSRSHYTAVAVTDVQTVIIR